MNFIKRHFIIIAILISAFFASTSYSQDNPDSLFSKAKLLMTEGKYEQSVAIFKILQKSEKESADLFYCLGLNYQSLSNFPEAVSSFEKALRIDPKNINIMILLGNNYFYTGQISNADSLLTNAFLLDSTDSRILQSLGKIYKQQNKWHKAADLYARLIKQDSSNSFYYEQLGNCNLNLKEIDDAIINYQIAHRLNPFNQNTVITLCQLYINKENYLSATRIVDDGLKIYPSSSIMWTEKGEIDLRMSNYTDAITDCKKSIAFGDSSGINFRTIGISYYWIEKYDSAIACLNNAVKIMEKDPSAYFYVGMCYKALKEYEKAIENFSKAVDLQRNDFLAESLIQIAATFYAGKNYQEALKYYRDALRENPEKKEIIFYIAAVYDHYYKDKTIAIKNYKKLLTITKKEDTDLKLIDYAKNRVKTLIEENHFNAANRQK
jgi:tetratricopeptide (TPR) repeat protein